MGLSKVWVYAEAGRRERIATITLEMLAKSARARLHVVEVLLRRQRR